LSYDNDKRKEVFRKYFDDMPENKIEAFLDEVGESL